MTAQNTDTFIYKAKEFELIGLKGAELFSPDDFGMVPEMLDTACYRGFICTYKIVRTKLLLHELVIREANGNYLPINGVQPGKQYLNARNEALSPESEGNLKAEVYTATYRDLKMAVAFTGKLRLARGFIKDLYIHMGFQKPTAFRTVYDLSLKEGKVIEVQDRSAEVEQKRGAFKARYESSRDIEAIEDAFSLDMDLK
jgi:hypothetical protein